MVKDAARGERAAFERLLKRYYDMMYRVSYRLTGHAQDAEDIAQEICVSLAHKIRSFRGDSSFSTWLYRLIVNTSRDYMKSRSNHRRLDQGYRELEAAQKADSADDNRNVAWLYRGIASLDEPFRETAMLVIAEELSHAEAGKVLNCAESTISWRMHEARKQLKLLWDSRNDG